MPIKRPRNGTFYVPRSLTASRLSSSGDTIPNSEKSSMVSPELLTPKNQVWCPRNCECC